MADLTWLGVPERRERVHAQSLTATHAVQAALERVDALNPTLNAFSQVRREAALAEAGALDAVPDEQRGPLFGVPIGIKEEIDVAGCVTTFGGRANTAPATRDAEVVSRLRDAGAVVIGKTCMPEFGQWPFTESEATGVTRNPWDGERSPGGSSGGSAVAVASGMVPVAMGGDGGGSIRIPASACGLFGLKPTRGRVSTQPHEHLWWALGCLGPLSRSVRDSAEVYDVISGGTEAEPYGAPDLVGSFVDAAQRDPGRLRIGWTLASSTPGVRVNQEVRRALQASVELLTELGHQVRDVDPRYPDVTRAFLPQFFAGVKAEADVVQHRDRLETRTKQTLALGRPVGTRVLERALTQGERVSARVNRIFDDLDVLLTPTLPMLPPRIGQLHGRRGVGASAPAALLRSASVIAYTALWNVTGNPAASLPWAWSRAGLPIGIQIIGPLHSEHRLISLAAQVEAATDWTARRPGWAQRLATA